MRDKDFSFEDALAIIHDECVCVTETEKIAREDSYERIAAADITAGMAVPRHANSAVDGYGFRYDDLRDGDNSLAIIGAVKAGHPGSESLPADSAMRVLTGAAINTDHIDTIVMEENITRNGDNITLQKQAIVKGSNLRLPGDDVNKGDVLVRQGTVITAAHAGLLAGQGVGEVSVFRRLKVGLLSSGDELCEPSTSPLSFGSIYDSNRPMLRHLLQARGYEVTDYGIIADDRTALQTALQTCRPDQCDVLLASGGMSLGEEDHLRAILAEDGHLSFWRIRCKPGRPTGLGFLPVGDRSLPVIGLPGNPVAAFVIFGLLGRAALARMSGEQYRPPTRLHVQLGEDIGKKPGRREFVRATIKTDESGTPLAYRCGKSGAAVLSSVSQADGFLDFAEMQGDSKKGDSADFIPMSAFEQF